MQGNVGFYKGDFMQGNCIFCRKELGLFQKKELSCGNTTQILCKECYEKYEPLSAVERAEAAFQTGRANDVVELKKYLENIWEAKAKKEEVRRQKNEKRVTDTECLRCQSKMIAYGPVTFKMGEETYWASDWNRLMTGSLTMNLLRCDNCGKVEFYLPNDEELNKILEKNSE